MARRLQLPLCSRAPEEVTALPQVASDPVVQRPLRADAPARPSAAPDEPSGRFGDMLDTSAAPAPSRADRTSRTRNSDSTDQPKAADNSAPNAAPPSGKADAPDTGSNSTKPADTSITQQAKDGQPSVSDSTVEAATTTTAADAGVATTPATTVDLALLVQAVPAATDAAAVATDAKPTSGDGDKAAASSKTGKTDSKKTKDSDDLAAAVTAGAKIDGAVPATAAVVAVPASASPATAPKTAGDAASVAPVELQGAPALPADRAAPATPDQVATDPDAADTPAPGKGDVTAAKPEQKADGAAPAADDASAKAAVTIDALADETNAIAPDKTKAAIETVRLQASVETKSSGHAERTTEAKARSEQHGEAAATQPRTSTSDVRPAAAPVEQDADGKAPVAHQPHAQSSEHVLSTHPATTEARAEGAANLVAAQPQSAQADANPSSLALNLAAPITSPVAASSSLTALRIDQPDNASTPVPVAGLAVEIVSRAQDGARRFEIRLDPPELGRIDVRLDVDSGGNVTSRLTVERADTLDLLRRDAPQLERALQHAGLNTEGGLQFSLRDQNFSNRDQMPRDAAPTHLIVPDDEPAAADAARRGYGRMIGLGGGVDIRV